MVDKDGATFWVRHLSDAELSLQCMDHLGRQRIHSHRPPYLHHANSPARTVRPRRVTGPARSVSDSSLLQFRFLDRLVGVAIGPTAKQAVDIGQRDRLLVGQALDVLGDCLDLQFGQRQAKLVSAVLIAFHPVNRCAMLMYRVRPKACGSRISYVSGLLRIALAWMPALW